MANTDISFTADERELLKAQAKVIKQQDQLIEKYKKVGKEGKKAGKDSTKAMEKYAATVKKMTATPIEKQKKEMIKLNAALKAGMITQTEYTRRVKQFNMAGSHAFGGMPGKIMAATGAFASVTAAAGKYLGILEDFKTKSDELAGKQRTDAESVGLLVQLAGNDPKKLAMLEGEARKTFREGGAKTYGGAAQQVFGLHSAGAGELRGLISELKQYNIVDSPAELVSAAKSMRDNLGEKETGNMEALFSKAFGASANTNSTADRLMAAASKGAQSAKFLKMSDEDLFAATAQMGDAANNVDTGGVQVAKYLAQLAKASVKGDYDFRGKSLRESVKMIDKEIEGGTSIFDILGENEGAIKTYRAISTETDIYDRNRRDVVAAEKDNMVRGMAVTARSSPMLRAVRAQRIAENRKFMKQFNRGTDANYSQAIQADIEGSMEGADPVTQWGVNKGVGLLRSKVGERRFAGMTGAMASEETRAALRDSGIDTSGRAQRAGAIVLAGPAVADAVLRSSPAGGMAGGAPVLIDLMTKAMHMLNGSSEKLDAAAGNLLEASEVGNQTSAARANQAAAGGATETR